MSAEARSYVTRHVRGIGTPERATLDVFAELASPAGRTRATQNTVAGVVELGRRQIERHCARLRQAGILRREGRTWVIVGVAGHNLARCEHPWCVREYRRKCRPKVGRPHLSKGGADRSEAPAAAMPSAANGGRAPAIAAAVATVSANPRPPVSPIRQWVPGGRKHKQGRRGRPP